MRYYTTIILSLLAGFVGAAAYSLLNIDEKASKAQIIQLPLPPSTALVRNASNKTKTHEQSAPVAFELAANKSVDAVVHVRTASRTQAPLSPWHEIMGYPTTDQIQEGTGSGVIISKEGHIVTNYHVIENADEIIVSMNNNRTYTAAIIGTDPSTDLAILQITNDTPTPFLAFGDSDELGIGEWVLAVGNPFDLTSTVTAGIVSAKARNLNLLRARPDRDVFPIESFIQTDAAVNPGNSGGALVNTAGELVGINTAIATKTGSYAGYSFAVPASIVKKVAKDLMQYGKVQRAYLGVQIEPVTEDMAATLAMNEVKGCAIVNFVKGSGAADSEIEIGDVVLAVNGWAISNFPELQECISRYNPGDSVAVQVWRGGAIFECKVQLRDRDGQPA